MRKQAYRKIGILLLILLVVMQFIQPKKNIAEGESENDIKNVYAIPADVYQTFVKKCYDCHSNNTNYPWYSNIQPIGWWLAAHVHDGKEHLNFSAFRNYDQKKAAKKLEDIAEVIEDGSMPLKLYVIFHKDSKLTAEEAKAINNWLASVQNKP